MINDKVKFFLIRVLAAMVAFICYRSNQETGVLLSTGIFLIAFSDYFKKEK